MTVSVAYAIRGTGQPLLMVNGTGHPAATWPPEFIESLARDHTVITFDHRGTGASPSAPGAYSTRTFAADAIDLVRRLEMYPVHVLGHSMGGRVAQWMALDAPEMLKSLTLAASGPGPFRSDQQVVRGVPPAVREKIEMLGYKGYLAEHIPWMFFTPEFIQAHPERVAWLVETFWENRPAVKDYLKHVAARQRHRTTHLLTRIHTPTLVLIGDRDTHAGGTGSHWDQSHYLAEHLPNAALQVIEGASHGLFYEKPEESVAAVRNWIAEHETTPAI